MDNFDKVNRAALEGAEKRLPTLAPLVEESLNDARAAYESAERELEELERKLHPEPAADDS